MDMPILATKLYIPPPPAKMVLRFRLIAQLNESMGHTPGVTLISAPAGFGKTSLISEWIADCQGPVAWLSLDERDSDPRRFLTGLIAAMQTIAPNIGAVLLGVLQSPQPPTESILTALLNEITAIPNKFVFVLDDYHLIESKPIDQALTYLLEHLPPLMHLVIITREDPNLSLARLRVQGRLTELRAADLRFTPTEATEFLNQVMGLSLTVEDIAALEDRTEGWVAGLQLAALSTRGRGDVHGFVKSFAGDNRYIVDYLVEEVLQRQPEPIRSFLLQTSILDRLNGPLCDAVTGQADSGARLVALQRGNFFVVPLDDKRHWYRYHHLFAEVLSLHLMAEQPDQVPALHRRASEWYEQNGWAIDAIRHALAGKDYGRAADLIELAIPALRQSRQETTMIALLKALPDELLCFRPVLSVHYAGALLLGGQIQGVEARLRDAERWLDTTVDTTEMVVRDEEEFRHLPGAIAVYRAAVALTQGDVPSTVKYAQRTLDLASQDDHLLRGAAAGFLGLTSWARGDLEEAHRSYTECMARMQKAGYLSDAMGCAVTLADIRIVQGRLREAMSTYEQGLQLTAALDEPALRGTADMYVGMSVLEREHNNLEAATQHLLKSKELGEFTGLPQNRYRWCVAMSRIKEAQGNLDGAIDLLDEAERLYVSDFFPYVRPVAASKTRRWVMQGRLGEALDWVQKQSLSAQDNLSYLREFEHITLARILLAQYRSGPADRSNLDAVGLLERLLEAAQEGGRMGGVIEILVLQALAKQALGDLPAALVPLERALALAEPEGYVRIFVDEGPAMAQLLREAAAHGRMPEYAGRLLTVFEGEKGTARDSLHPIPGKSEDKSSLALAYPLVEPLSERELEVLKLIAQGLSNGEISAQLFLALNTIKGHIQKIFEKLHVQRRTEAVARARELGLL